MDDFPKVWVKRETDSLDMDTWGPFTNVGDLRDAVKTLQKIFRFATCQIPMWERDEKRKYFRPCLLPDQKRILSVRLRPHEELCFVLLVKRVSDYSIPLAYKGSDDWF